jgi:hypothetical protein
MTGMPRLDELAGEVVRRRATHDPISRPLAD